MVFLDEEYLKISENLASFLNVLWKTIGPNIYVIITACLNRIKFYKTRYWLFMGARNPPK
jgi:hypothetical protein